MLIFSLTRTTIFTIFCSCSALLLFELIHLSIQKKKNSKFKFLSHSKHSLKTAHTYFLIKNIIEIVSFPPFVCILSPFLKRDTKLKRTEHVSFTFICHFTPQKTFFRQLFLLLYSTELLFLR
jgi:hypothetical protein